MHQDISLRFIVVLLHMLVMIFIQQEDEYYKEKSTFDQTEASFGLLMQYHQVALTVTETSLPKSK